VKRQRAPANQWPACAPVDLRVAYDAIRNIPPEKWVKPDDGDYLFSLMDGALSPVDYFIGIGKQSKCIALIHKLATDPRMRVVWLRLNGLETGLLPQAETELGMFRKLKRPVRGGVQTRLRVGQSVSCSLVQGCALAIEAATNQAHYFTKESWKRRHVEIAEAARHLSDLLADDVGLDESLQNPRLMLTAESLRQFASELCGNVRLLDSSDSDLDLDTPESQEVIDAKNAEWDQEVE